MFKKGFTLAELAITIGIIGVVATVALPTLKDTKPSHELVKFKKAYFMVEKNISELIHDETLYPIPVSGIEDKGLGETSEVEYHSISMEGATKLCFALAVKMNISDDASCKASLTFPDSHFVTSDDIAWLVPISDFVSASKAYPIYVDVNGVNVGNNCFYNKDSCKEPDRFTIYIYRDGKVTVFGTAEAAYLQTKNLSKDRLKKLLETAPQGVDIDEVNTNALTQGTVGGVYTEENTAENTATE